MNAPDDQVLEAFSSLEDNHYFKKIMEWVGDTIQSKTASLLMERDDIEMRRLQGSVTDLREIADLADGARQIIALKRKSQKS